MNLGDWQLLYVMVVVTAGIAGSIWILFDASNRFGALTGLTLALASALCTYCWRFPWVALAYLAYYLLAFYYFHRELPEDKLPRFGLRLASGDPVTEAKKLGLPSVMGRIVDDAVDAGEEIPEIEELLRAGKVAEATVHAESALKAAERDGHKELAERLRKYVLRLQRGKY